MQSTIPSDHLEIRQARKEEVYRDIVRIPEAIRLNLTGEQIDEGRICKIKAGSKQAYVIVRGVKGLNTPTHIHERCIHMDEVTRERLGVTGLPNARFDLKPVGWWGQILWAWNATEIGYQISVRLGLVGLVLGMLGLIPLLSDLPKWVEKLARLVQEHLCVTY